MKVFLFYFVIIAFGIAYFLKAKKEYRRLINEKADGNINPDSDADPSKGDTGADSST